jgi:SAM-dependent methyltransferase/uncharacterized protein YbaR (Trm112 family)
LHDYNKPICIDYGGVLNSRNLTFLKCPNCSSSSLSIRAFESIDNYDVQTGIVTCDDCKNWYRIENGILDFLPLAMRRKDLYKKFAENHNISIINDQIDLTIDSQKANQQEFFNAEADDYEKRVVNSRFSQVYDQTSFIDWLDRNKHKMEGLVLEIGCGTGRQSIPLGMRGIQTIAGDISEEMLILAQKKIENAGLRKNVDLIVFDGENPPVTDNTFDAVIIYGVLHHLKNKGNAIKNASEKLRPNGLFYSLDPHKSPVRIFFDLVMFFWKIYNEEADDDPLLSSAILTKWLSEAGIDCKIRLTFYLPPHLFNYLSYETGVSLLKGTDSFFNRIPFVRNFAGIIISEGIKHA